MKQRVIFVVLFFIVWLTIFALQHPLFMLYNQAMTDGVTADDWLQVIRHGLKLDSTVTGYLTAIPLLCTLVSVWLPGAWLRKMLRVYLAVVCVVVSAILFTDVALYGYWNFRLDATVFFYLQSPKDALASVPTILLASQVAMFAGYALFVWWFVDRLVLIYAPEEKVKNRLSGTIIMVLMGGILFLPIRGGVTTSTANVGMVYFSRNQFLNHAAINPCFSMMTSLSKQQDFAAQFNFLPEEERKETMEMLYPADRNQPRPDQSLLTTGRPNILLILLESFSANAIEPLGGTPGVTPRLNELAKEGVLFTNMYANSFRTDRGIVSVLNGYLAQPTTSIMKYPAKSQTLPSIAGVLGKEGYVSDMLYGGDINFTNMQSYFFSSGYSKITADRDFPLNTRLSKWGANDDVTFAHLYKEISGRQSETPWLTTFLTLSSHEPFEVPYKRLDDPYLNSVAFTDSCIGDFIDKVKLLPVWNNLLVILVSDHGFRYPDGVQESDPLRYHIPMLWLGGAVRQPVVVDTLANQTDLAATLLRQLNLPVDDFIFSKDIFNPSAPHFSFYTFNNGFGFIDSTGLSVFDNESLRPLLEEPTDGSSFRLQKGQALLQTLYDDLGNR